MPGSVATLATCSTARSSTAFSISDWEANTTPGTRIPSTLPMGIRHSNSPILSTSTSRSHVEEHGRFPPHRRFAHRELVIGSRLQLGPVGRIAAGIQLDTCPHRRVTHLIHPNVRHARVVAFHGEQELVEPRHQERSHVARVEGNLDGPRLLTRSLIVSGSPGDPGQAPRGVLEALFPRPAPR